MMVGGNSTGYVLSTFSTKASMIFFLNRVKKKCPALTDRHFTFQQWFQNLPCKQHYSHTIGWRQHVHHKFHTLSNQTHHSNIVGNGQEFIDIPLVHITLSKVRIVYDFLHDWCPYPRYCYIILFAGKGRSEQCSEKKET